MVEQQRKRARSATHIEIFPGKHGPVQDDAADLMKQVLGAFRAIWSNHHITVFVAEKEVQDGSDRLPRFNYGSTGAREDMIAVLKAFIAKNDEMAAVDAAMAEKPQGSA